MEINKFEDVLGVVAQADTVEGRFVVLTTNAFSHNFGSDADLAGAVVPATAEAAKRAKYILTWAVDNRQTPIYMPTPSMDFALRGGFDQAANAPFNTKVYLTYPGYQEGHTIPSGTKCLAYTEGTFTLPSGSFVYSADIIKPGAALVVGNTADDTTDAGKVKYTATFAAGVIGVTEKYDSVTNRLTVRVE